MKNNKFLFVPLIALLFYSCEDYFEQAILPATTLTDNWTSNNDLEKLTVSSYYFWQGYHEGIGDMGVMIPTFASDEALLSPDRDDNIEYGNHDQLYLRETDNRNIPWLAYVWQSGYEVVRTSNIVINHLNEFGAFEDTNSQWEDRLKGENYFCRAFAFYTLSKIFAPPYNISSDMNVPGIIVNTDNAVGAFDTDALSSVQTAYDQIISDLENAILYLPESYDANRDPEGYQDRAKKDAARFLLARVYFQMGAEYWEKSLEQINQILDKNLYTLEADPSTAFTQRNLGQTSTETIFHYAAYSATSRWRIPSMYYYLGAGSGSGRKTVLEMSDHYIEYLGWDDETLAENDKRYNSLFVKYSNGIWADKWKTIGDNSPLMRLSELYLTRATISLLTGLGGGNAQAIEDLNILRARAYINNTPLDSSLSTSELIDIAHKERAIELFFEGDRLYYIQALRGDISCGDRGGDATCLPFDSSKLYWKIPEREVNLNNNIDL